MLTEKQRLQAIVAMLESIKAPEVRPAIIALKGGNLLEAAGILTDIKAPAPNPVTLAVDMLKELANGGGKRDPGFIVSGDAVRVAWEGETTDPAKWKL